MTGLNDVVGPAPLNKMQRLVACYASQLNMLTFAAYTLVISVLKKVRKKQNTKITVTKHPCTNS